MTWSDDWLAAITLGEFTGPHLGPAGQAMIAASSISDIRIFRRKPSKSEGEKKHRICVTVQYSQKSLQGHALAQ